MKQKMKKLISQIIELVSIQLLITFIVWLISRKVDISFVWIISPIWMIPAYFLSAVFISFIQVPFQILGQLIGYKKYLKNKEKKNDRTNSEENESEI